MPLQPNQLCMATQDFDGPVDGVSYICSVCNKVRLTDILITLAAWATRFADY